MSLFEADIVFDNERIETGHLLTKDLLTVDQIHMLVAQALQGRFGPLPWEVGVRYSDENNRWEWKAKQNNGMHLKAELNKPTLQMPPGTSRN